MHKDGQYLAQALRTNVAEQQAARERELEKLLSPPPEILKWLHQGQTRKGQDGVRRPRRVRWGRLSSASLVNLFNMQGGLCCYCAEPMTLPPTRTRRARKTWPTDAEVTDVGQKPEPYRPLPTDVTRDHLLAKSQGGPGLLSNFAAACRLCNEEKGDLPLVIFILARSTNTLREAHRRQEHIRKALAEQAKPGN